MRILKNYENAGSHHGGAGRITPTGAMDCTGSP